MGGIIVVSVAVRRGDEGETEDHVRSGETAFKGARLANEGCAQPISSDDDVWRCSCAQRSR